MEGDYLYLQKRREKDIWQSLYSMPMLEAATLWTADDLLASKEFKAMDISPFNIGKITDLKHQLTHQTINARFFRLEGKDIDK